MTTRLPLSDDSEVAAKSDRLPLRYDSEVAAKS